MLYGVGAVDPVTLLATPLVLGVGGDARGVPAGAAGGAGQSDGGAAIGVIGLETALSVRRCR